MIFSQLNYNWDYYLFFIKKTQLHSFYAINLITFNCCRCKCSLSAFSGLAQILFVLCWHGNINVKCFEFKYVPPRYVARGDTITTIPIRKKKVLHYFRGSAATPHRFKSWGCMRSTYLHFPIISAISRFSHTHWPLIIEIVLIIIEIKCPKIAFNQFLLIHFTN